MSRILLLLAHAENRRLLAATLAAQGHAILVPDVPSSSSMPAPPSRSASGGRTNDAARLVGADYDLGIVDGPSLDAFASAIRERREAAAHFLPFLLVSARHDSALVARYLRDTVDEWLSTPVQKVELYARIGTLLRLRHVSQEAADKAQLEGVLLAARTLEHEVSNKLVATAGYTERLAANPDLPPALRERAERAHQNAKDASAMIRRVLALSEAAGAGRRAGLPITDWGDAGGKTIDLSAA